MKKLLIQKGEVTIDTLANYGVYVKHVPFQLFPKIKELYKNSWHDEDGDDEYLPAEPSYEAYEMKIDFFYKGLVNSANSQIKLFLEFLQGDWLTIYDQYSGIGRQKVRYVSVDSDASLYRRDFDAVEFSVIFKVNDPNTQVALT